MNLLERQSSRAGVSKQMTTFRLVKRKKEKKQNRG